MRNAPESSPAKIAKREWVSEWFLPLHCPCRADDKEINRSRKPGGSPALFHEMENINATCNYQQTETVIYREPLQPHAVCCHFPLPPCCRSGARAQISSQSLRIGKQNETRTMIMQCDERGGDWGEGDRIDSRVDGAANASRRRSHNHCGHWGQHRRRRRRRRRRHREGETRRRRRRRRWPWRPIRCATFCNMRLPLFFSPLQMQMQARWAVFPVLYISGVRKVSNCFRNNLSLTAGRQGFPTRLILAIGWAHFAILLDLPLKSAAMPRRPFVTCPEWCNPPGIRFNFAEWAAREMGLARQVPSPSHLFGNS